ncbi:MAG: 16S rRNA (guanine(527)-N(7))-methyltransferase RsmG [Candidatus Gastranaerophilales bacterium]|nr:16S rRNA (guanine(527)-N(7))-methyltransferase RsmG [Candidatus Gastranaerophilales bacterium]
MYKQLEKLSLVLSEQNVNELNLFSSFFKEYNDKVNLISNNDVKFLFEKHIFDSLAFNLFYKKYCKTNQVKLLDIGAGGGFPSVPISFIYENIDVIPLDSINKKINFIKEVKEKFNLNNINPICSRVEDLPLSSKSSFDIVTSRAMAELRMIVEYAIPYLKVGGYFVAYKSIKAQEEIENAKNALKILNSKVVDIIEYSLPIDEENKRCLIVIKKEKEVPFSYPRKNGLVKKKPL